MIQIDTRAMSYPTVPALNGADVHEDHGFFVVHADLQGVDREHLGVALDHGDLVVSGESRPGGLGFYRRLPLPFAAEGTPDYSFAAGRLEVRIPIPEDDGTPVESRTEFDLF
jgi:HSP20 family molecular chaperone IbpA